MRRCVITRRVGRSCWPSEHRRRETLLPVVVPPFGGQLEDAMSVADWISPILAFGGAALGAALVYRMGREQERGRRFQAALNLLASTDERQRALGRARIVETSRRGSAGAGERREALAVLRQDLKASCPAQVWRKLATSTPGEVVSVWLADEDGARVEGNRVFVTRSLMECAEDYVEVAGGADAAPDQVMVLISQATSAGIPEVDQVGEAISVRVLPAARPLPTDQRLVLIKLTADAAALGTDALRERARKAWRLSLERLKSEPPAGVAAVVQQRVIGAWQFRGVVPSAEQTGKVEFVLGDDMPDLVGCEYRDTGQNPVRYWP
jgi:hypothetical protein